MILLSRSEEIILLAVFKLQENAYGVTIRERVRKDIGRSWSFGVIYKTLNKLNAKNYVRKITGDPLAERGGRSRYFYHITTKGMNALEEIRKVQSSIWRDIPSLSQKEKSE